MRAVVVETPGGLDHLQLIDVPEPLPGPGEVVIEVHFAACNWSDIQKRQGVYPVPVTYPIVLGLELSGRIARVGPSVRGLKQGDRVAAMTGPYMMGGFAEYCLVGADYVIKLPKDVPLKLGAAFPVTTLTAYHLLYSAHRIRKGETILVHAIGGAVGLMLTQIARNAGARVIGTVSSTGKGVRATAYGAERIVVRDDEDFVTAALDFTGGKGIDLVIDSLGGDILERSFDTLRTYGRIINIGEAAGYPKFDIRPKLYERSTSLAGFELHHAEPGSTRWRRGVRYVLEAMSAGRLEVPIEAVYPLEAVRDAQAQLEARGVSGKLLLEVTQNKPRSG